MDAQVDHIFVYGTLMTGQRGAKLMEHCTLEGTTSVPGVMYDLIGFPGLKLIPDVDTLVKGELYQLPSVAGKSLLVRSLVLQRLDSFEGVPVLYTRRTIPVTHAKRTVPAFMYELNGTHADADMIPSGCWLTHQRECYHV